VSLTAKALARRCGHKVSRISDMLFGQDPWIDVSRLGERWCFPIIRVFDVGTNIGLSSLKVLDHFPKAEVYSFEPHPETFKGLVKTLKRPRAKVFNIALSGKSGRAELFTYNNDLINSLTPTAATPVRLGVVGKPIPIQVSTVDEFCSSGGQASTLNAGIAHSRGKIICFLDSDDLWYFDKISRSATRKLLIVRQTASERAQMRSWRARRRLRDALPKRIHELARARANLIKEAKGLGRSS
jgi:FkbM family methyltransferase